MTDENKDIERGGAFLLPPASNVCQECAVDHEPGQAHNAQSLYYQMHFRSKHGRWPTWKDAIAHCDPEVRQKWEEELKQRGAWTEPTSTVPDVCPMEGNMIGTTTVVPIKYPKRRKRKK